MAKSQTDNLLVEIATLGANYTNLSASVATISNDIKDIKGQYVTRDEFNLVKWIVFGFVGLIITAFAAVLISVVIPQHPTTTNSVQTVPLPVKSAQ